MQRVRILILNFPEVTKSMKLHLVAKRKCKGEDLVTGSR